MFEKVVFKDSDILVFLLGIEMYVLQELKEQVLFPKRDFLLGKCSFSLIPGHVRTYVWEADFRCWR